MTERLGEPLEAAGDWPAAADCWLRGIEIEPLADGFCRRSMQACMHLGRRQEALAAYERCRRTMLGRQGVSPMRHAQVLHQALAERL